MTIEEKAKLYDEAVENMRKFRNALNNHEEIDLWVLKKEIVKDIEYYFPELKESEDERIRKAIIDIIKSQKEQQCHIDSTIYDEMLDWLEKQGEQNPVVKIKTPEESLGIDSDIYNKIVDECIYDNTEQKTDDKAEPKFKVGDWVVRDNTTAQILDIQEQYYIGLDIDGDDFTSSKFLSDDKIHLWTIADAKPGDVLVDIYENIGIFEKRYGINWHTYCYLGNEGRFISEGGSHGSICYPATKEQRDLLFQKMKETGYEWNAEKKELEKIIDEKQIKKNLQDNSFRRMFEQKSVWSEDDEFQMQGIIDLLPGLTIRHNWLKSLKDRVLQIKQEWSEEDSIRWRRIINFLWYNRKGKTSDTIYEQEQDIEWLKSLKGRIQPKQEWSEKDLEMLSGIELDLSMLMAKNPDCEFKKLYQEEIDWLKSLKPQKHQ